MLELYLIVVGIVLTLPLRSDRIRLDVGIGQDGSCERSCFRQRTVGFVQSLKAIHLYCDIGGGNIGFVQTDDQLRILLY